MKLLFIRGVIFALPTKTRLKILLKSLLCTHVLYDVTAVPFLVFFYSWQLRKNTENSAAVTSLRMFIHSNDFSFIGSTRLFIVYELQTATLRLPKRNQWNQLTIKAKQVILSRCFFLTNRSLPWAVLFINKLEVKKLSPLSLISIISVLKLKITIVDLVLLIFNFFYYQNCLWKDLVRS